MKGRPGAFKDINIPSLDGMFDSRSPVGKVGFGNFRVVLNMDSTEEKSRCRLGGWSRFLGDSPYGFKNQDFHDQLLSCLTYADSNQQVIQVNPTGTEFAYPYWAPPFDTNPSVSWLDPVGPYYGYAPDYYGLYPTEPSPNQPFICQVHIGQPFDPAPLPYWNPDVNQPDFTVPQGSDFPSMPSNPFHVYFANTSNSVQCQFNSTCLGKIAGVGPDVNPNDNLDDSHIRWWMDQTYAALIAERAAMDPPRMATKVQFFWEWSPVGAAWGISNDPNQDVKSGSFYCHIAAGWTLAALFADKEGVGDDPSGGANTGLSYFSLCQFQQVPGTHTDGYGYGTLQPLNPAPYSYNYQYCGDTYIRDACRETITMLHESSSVAGHRKFLLGTKSRLAVLNERSGNWRLLADGLGGPYSDDRNCGCHPDRFKVGQLGNIVVFTNNIDPVLFWAMDSGPQGCDDWSADYIQELLDLNITKAKVVVSWRGFIFIGNVEQEGERHSNRIFWCDYNQPLTWFPGGDTLAFTQDLADGDRIVAMETIGQQLRIYTRNGANQTAIYDVMLVGGDATFNFQEVYRGPDGVQYEHSLVNIGDVHYWVSESGIMEIGAYDRTPNRIEWIHRASGVIDKGLPGSWLGPISPVALTFGSGSWSMVNGFGSINKNACEQVNGFFDSINKALWFSWPTEDQECPTMSLRMNLQYKTASLVDHGFTTGCMMRPDYAPSLRDFLAQYAGCEPSTLIMAKEGMPYELPTPGVVPAYIRNQTEDPDLPVDPNSVCARLTGLTIDDLCAECDADSMLVMADAQDRTLKQFTPTSYKRERFIGMAEGYYCPYTADGEYVDDGYWSLIQADAESFSQKVEKLIRRAEVDYVAEDQIVPSELSFEIGCGAQPGCIFWDDSAPPNELRCLTNSDAAEHASNNTRPDLLASYNFFRRGAFLAWRAYTNGIGGASCWNEATLSVRLASGDWT